MRKLTFLCTFICFGLIVSAQSGEEQNVRKALQDFVDAYSSPDSTAWEKSWVHDATVTNTFSSRDFYRETVGWDSLQAIFNRQSPNASDKFEIKNIAIKNNDNLAMADFDMIYTAGDPATIYPYTGSLTYHNYLLLVKDGGQWKVNKRIVTFPGSYAAASQTAENDLNAAGYNLLGANKIKEAIEIFRLNAKLYPASWNVFDSLGEGLAAAGNKKEAIENYEKSIKINPKNESGKAALVKLKQK